jgi:hypothetical protein
MKKLLFLIIISVVAFTTNAEKLTQCNTGSCVKYFKKFQKSANRGHAQAMAMVGEFYYHGYGVKKDANAALKYYKKAARKGITSAQYKAGLAYLINPKLKDVNKGLSYLQKAAEAQYKDASFLLGKIYLSNEFNVKDLILADKYLAQSYRQKNPDVLKTISALSESYADINSNSFPLLSKVIKNNPPMIKNDILVWDNKSTEVITVTSMKLSNIFDMQLSGFKQPIKTTGSRLHGVTCEESVYCKSLSLRQLGDYIQ